MTRRFRFRPFRRFARDEGGTVAVVEFAVMFPVFLTMFLSGLEMGFMTIRQTLMESAVDRAVREVRIGTEQAVTHDWLRERICAYAGLLPDCENALKLELRSTDLRVSGNTLGDAPDCTNRDEDLNPVVAFNNGQRNEMMVMRACFVFEPVFPNIGFGYNAEKNSAGDIAIYATTAFVNEPS